MTGIWGLEQRLAKLEREDPEVAKAAAGYRAMRERLTGRGLSSAELARLYDVSVPLSPEEESAVLEARAEREILSPTQPVLPPQDVSPGQS